MENTVNIISFNGIVSPQKRAKILSILALLQETLLSDQEHKKTGVRLY